MNTNNQFTGKTSDDKRFAKYYDYEDFNDPQLFNRQVELSQDYLSRVAGFMAGSESSHFPVGKSISCNISQEDEKLMFTQFNYAKMKMATATNQEQFNEWEDIALSLRQNIMYANLFLVPSMIKTIKISISEMQDLISEGLIGLMRAIHKFDQSKNFKFSTYAFHVIRRAMIRYILEKGAKTNHNNQYVQEMIYLNQFATDDNCDNEHNKVAIEMHKAIGCLTERQREIIYLRYPINGDQPLSLRALGKKIGLTAERVRQIQDEAIKILRQYMVGKDIQLTGD